MASFNVENYQLYWSIRRVLLKLNLCEKRKQLNEELQFLKQIKININMTISKSTNYQNSIQSVQITLNELPKFINTKIKNGVQILRVVKNGFDKDANQLVFIDLIDLKRA